MVATVAALADPLFTIGCYFIGVHAYRHTRRLACTSAIVDPERTDRGHEPGFARRVLRVHRLSMPLMWPTALCLAPLCWLLGGFHAGAIATASIAFYMITTLPHHLLGLKLPNADKPPAAAH
jgi:hypothetical protein